jgi:hypothetical protein
MPVTLRIAAAAALAIAALVLSTQPSLADSWVRQPGASASFQSAGDKFRAWDTACDGRSIYLRYQTRPGAEQRIGFSGGCHQQALWDLELAEDLPIAYRICIDIRFGADDCSDVRGPATWMLDTT